MDSITKPNCGEIQQLQFSSAALALKRGEWDSAVVDSAVSVIQCYRFVLNRFKIDIVVNLCSSDCDEIPKKLKFVINLETTNCIWKFDLNLD